MIYKFEYTCIISSCIRFKIVVLQWNVDYMPKDIERLFTISRCNFFFLLLNLSGSEGILVAFFKHKVF